jgi:F0F1-type ATP synthase assembly protein I
VARSLTRALGLATSIGVPFAVLVSSGALAGSALDRKLHATPWFTLGGVVLGTVLSIANLVRVVGHFQRLNDDDEPKRGGGGGAPGDGGG